MKSNAGIIIKTTVILTLICAVAAAALGVTNYFTEDAIKEQEEKSAAEAMSRVIAADSYEEKTVTFEGAEYVYNVARSGGNTEGYIFTVSENGYGGAVKVMIGIKDGKTEAVEVLDASTETPGLGQKSTDPGFRDGFKGKSGGLTAAKDPKSETEIKALTGATITSKAVTAAVNKAYEIYETVKGAE